MVTQLSKIQRTDAHFALAPDARREFVPARVRQPSVGVITNHRSRRNQARIGLPRIVSPGVVEASPRSHAELAEVLRAFRRHGMDLLVIDGGDGTVRDVLSASASIFETMPDLAVIPSGKTNALALDLGVPLDWTVAGAIEAFASDSRQIRAPIEIRRDGDRQAALRGFLLGMSGFVRATTLAQGSHRWGAFNGLAVGLSLAMALGQTLFGAGANPWQRGTRIRIARPDGSVLDDAFYLGLASTLERMPIGLRPFGAPRPGLKMLAIEAPPRRLASSFGPLIRGSDSPRLAERGYHRFDGDAFDVTLDGDFVLDGEAYAGGAFQISKGAPLRFVVP